MKRRKCLPQYAQKNFCHQIHVAVPYYSEGESHHRSFFIAPNADNDRVLEGYFDPRVTKVLNDDPYYNITPDGCVDDIPGQFIISGYIL